MIVLRDTEKRHFRLVYDNYIMELYKITLQIQGSGNNKQAVYIEFVNVGQMYGNIRGAFLCIKNT